MSDFGRPGTEAEMAAHLSGINLVRDGFWVQDFYTSLTQIAVPEEAARKHNLGAFDELFLLHLHVDEGLGGRTISMNIVMTTEDMTMLKAGIKSADAARNKGWRIGDLDDPFVNKTDQVRPRPDDEGKY